MESQKPKIALHVKRPFGDKFNTTMDSIKENREPVLKFSICPILPLYLIQTISIDGIMGGTMGFVTAKGTRANPLEAIGAQLWVSCGLMLLCYLVEFILLTSIAYGLMQIHNQRGEHLAGVILAGLKPFPFKNIKRLLTMALLYIALITAVSIVIGTLATAFPFTLLLTVPLPIACIVPSALLTPIYLFGEIGIFAASQKTFRLGFVTWGGAFDVSSAMGLIFSVL